MDPISYNRQAWDRQVESGNRWTIPVSPEEIAEARQGRWRILLTSDKSVPCEWFPPLQGIDVLCLASGGGQQGPILAAAGARVTVLDNSPRQLAQDRMVAEREGLELTTVQGQMADLSAFGDASFDLIVHPISNCFAPDVLPVWREAYRVLRSGGVLMAGFNNPAVYIFDFDALAKEKRLLVKYRLPYSDQESPSAEVKRAYAEQGMPLEFSHSLEEQIGGQLAAGFFLTALYEDTEPEADRDLLGETMPIYIATRAVKP